MKFCLRWCDSDILFPYGFDFLETNVFVEQVIVIPGHFALRVFHCICYFRHFLNRRRNLSQEVNWFWSHWFFCKTEMRDCGDCTKWWVFHSLKKLLILMTHMNWPQTTPRRSWLSTWGSGEFSCLLSQMNICRQPDGGGEFSCLLSQMNICRQPDGGLILDI